ncbi:MAG: hypothetical protein IMW92_07775 [Bacillales bacterium]|nr:hypothetical protein [Bacillales bacterium]
MEEGNRIFFEILEQILMEELSEIMPIQQEHHLNIEFNDVEAIVKRNDTENILLDLIQRGASIRRVEPMNGMKTEIYNKS